MYSWAISLASVVFRQGIEIVRFLKQSTRIRIALYLLWSFSSLQKSIDICCYSRLGIGSGFSSPSVLLHRIVDLWQSLQFCTNWLILVVIPSQQQRSIRILQVLVFPRQAIETYECTSIINCVYKLLSTTTTSQFQNLSSLFSRAHGLLTAVIVAFSQYS